MATRAKETSAAGETAQLVGSATTGAVGGGLTGAAAGTAVGATYGLLGAAPLGLLAGVASMTNPIGWVGAGLGAVAALTVGLLSGASLPTMAWVAPLVGLATPPVLGAVGALMATAGMGMAIGGGLGAGLGGANSALRTKDKIEAQDQQYALQKGAGRDMMQQAYNKGRTDGVNEYGPKFYAQGASEMAQMAEQQFGPAVMEARNQAIMETTQAVREQLEARKAANAHEFVSPGEAKDGGFVQRCCNHEKPGLDGLKKDTTPAGIKLAAETKGAEAPVIQ